MGISINNALNNALLIKKMINNIIALFCFNIMSNSYVTLKTIKVLEKGSKRITIILDPLHPSKYIRVEEEEEEVTNSFAANYFYIIIPKENMMFINEYIIKFNSGLINDECIKITESNCPRVYQVQIFPSDNIELFDHAWSISEQLDLGPFQEYIHMF
jgi:hypothetical protein